MGTWTRTGVDQEFLRCQTNLMVIVATCKSGALDIKMQYLAGCVEGTVNLFVYGLDTVTLSELSDLSVFDYLDTASFVRVNFSELQMLSESFQIVDGVLLGCDAEFMPMVYANYFDSSEVTIILHELLDNELCSSIIANLRDEYPEVTFEVKSRNKKSGRSMI